MPVLREETTLYREGCNLMAAVMLQTVPYQAGKRSVAENYYFHERRAMRSSSDSICASAISAMSP